MSQSLVRFVANFPKYIVNIHLNTKKDVGYVLGSFIYNY